MKTDSDTGIARGRYAAETRERMAHLISSLLNIQRSGSGDTSGLSHRIDQQEQASRLAGFDRVARLCQTMEASLAGLRSGELPGLAAAITTLLDVCRAIELHAEAIARMTVELDGSRPPRRRDPLDRQAPGMGDAAGIARRGRTMRSPTPQERSDTPSKGILPVASDFVPGEQQPRAPNP